jgi:hypothetical protein
MNHRLLFPDVSFAGPYKGRYRGCYRLIHSRPWEYIKDQSGYHKDYDSPQEAELAAMRHCLERVRALGVYIE